MHQPELENPNILIGTVVYSTKNMFEQIEQFLLPNHQLTYLEGQIDTITKPIKAFQQIQLEESNITTVLKQIKVFEPRRREELTNNTMLFGFQQHPFYSIGKKYRLERPSFYEFQNPKKLLLSDTSLSSVIEPSLSASIRSKFKSGRISLPRRKEKQSFSQAPNRDPVNSVKKEQVSYPTENKSSTILVPLDEIPKLRSHATRLRKVLLEIDTRQTDNNNNPVCWEPKKWFGNANTNGFIAKWSKALRILINKGLVSKEMVSERRFSSNSGNAKTLVSLTAKGRQCVRQLRNSY